MDIYKKKNNEIEKMNCYIFGDGFTALIIDGSVDGRMDRRLSV